MNVIVRDETPADIGPQLLELRRLTGLAGELAELQRVLEGAPTYFELVDGAPAGATEARETYAARPEGAAPEDKHVLGVYLDGAMIGVVDLIRGFPDARTAMLGLFVLAEAWQGRGLGARAYRRVEEYVRAWRTCERIRLGVVAANARVVPFWEAMGFVATGERRPWEQGEVVSEVIVFEKVVAG